MRAGKFFSATRRFLFAHVEYVRAICEVAAARDRANSSKALR